MSIVRATAWSNLGEAVQLRNVFTYQSSGGELNEGGKTAITARLMDLFGTLGAHLTTVWAMESVHFEELVEGVWQPRGEQAAVMAGGSEDDILPFMNCALVLAVTGFAKTIGKKFIGGWTEATNVDGAVIDAVVTHLVSVLGYYIGSVTGSQGQMYYPGTVSKTGVFHQFIGGRVNDLFATQRRRHPSVGI
jgi:hypothetical protein